jgi:uncharacterized protein YxjI
VKDYIIWSACSSYCRSCLFHHHHRSIMGQRSSVRHVALVITSVTAAACRPHLSAEAFQPSPIAQPQLLPATIAHRRQQQQEDASSCKKPTLQLLRMNPFDAFLGRGRDLMKPVEQLEYGAPILSAESSNGGGSCVTLAIQERALSFTGEDFDVVTVPDTRPVCKVRGAMLHLPGKDRMRLVDPRSNSVVGALDRKLIALTPTYDIFRGSEKIGWIERKTLAFRDTFDIHLEATPKMGPIKPPAAFYVEGDFLDRQFVMKNRRGDAVAVVSKSGFFPQFDAFNHYQVKVAPGMDVGLVIASACAIDEEFDEEHQKRAEERKRKAEGGGGWFG